MKLDISEGWGIGCITAASTGGHSVFLGFEVITGGNKPQFLFPTVYTRREKCSGREINHLFNEISL